ncbi:MAG TPA: hypothetical protein VHV51_12595 [Polyangiaceae bacterium]|nr:hypothetical protein [Polyangiaceae bacterium]
MPALRNFLGLLGVAFAAGCTPKIGDQCTVSTDCSTQGDRICDITEPGGYCTVFGCEPDDCPDNALCVNFGTTLSVGDPGSATSPGTVLSGCTVSQNNSPYQRSFCLASCESDSDCRADYKCIEPETIGGVKADVSRSNKVCAVPRMTTDPAQTSNSNQVCIGSDAGPLESTASGGSANADAGSADAGGMSGAGGASGADNAGAGD